MLDNEFNVLEVLKLIEYSIEHIDELNKSSKNITLEKIRNPKSEILKNILTNKIYRPATVPQLDIDVTAVSYYYQNDKFHIFRIENGIEVTLFSFENVYQVAGVDEYSLILFDSKGSFYFISSNRLKKPSPKIKINDAKDQILPYQVRLLSNNLISITFPELRKENNERVFIYDYKKEKRIQDLSKLF